MAKVLSRLMLLTCGVLAAVIVLSAPLRASEDKTLHFKERPPSGPTFERLFVFGDSLSDTGNLNALTDGALPATSPPYFEGRFSNGPLWVEALAHFLRIDLKVKETVVVNPLAQVQAVGGALSGTGNANALLAPEVAGTGVLGQIESFRAAGGRFNRKDLVILWVGANDYIIDFETDPVSVTDNLRVAIIKLASLGARYMIVPNLPNLGDTPFAQSRGLQVPLNALTFAHNELLARTVRRAQRKLKTRILLLDVHRAFLGLEDLFDNIQIPCIVQDPPNPPTETGICPPNDEGIPDSTADGGTLYMDVIHPTTQAHDLLGAFAFGGVTQAFQRKRKFGFHYWP